MWWKGAGRRLRLRGLGWCGQTEPAPKPRAVPLDAAKEAALAKSLADAPDGKLKDALMKLGRGVLRRSR